MSGAAVMNGWIASLRNVAASEAERVEIMRAELEADTKRTAAAGTTPDGAAWKPTQTGAAPLQGAPEAISSSVQGSTAIVEINGHHVVHHYGTKKDPKRQIIPETISRSLADAFKDKLLKSIERKLK